MREDNNKTKLFHFLADKICDFQTSSTIIVTNGEDVISKSSESLVDISPCSHEEADTRVFVHAKNATADGSYTLFIKTNDTDFLVIAVSVLPICSNLTLRRWGSPLVREQSSKGFPA